MKTLTPLFVFTSLLVGSSASAQITIIADAAADYLTAPSGSTTTAPTETPAGWSYLYSDAASEGIEVDLTAETLNVGLANNTGFGGGARFRTPVVLGSMTNGVEFEIFSDGFSGSGNVSPGHGAIVGEDLLLHPGDSSETAFVIIRYTISAEDIAADTSVNITGSFRDQVIQVPNKLNENNWGSVDAFIYHNTTELFAVDQEDAEETGGELSLEDGTFEISNLTVAEGDTISFVISSNSSDGLFFGDETALQAAITQGSESGSEISITAIPESDELEIRFPTVEGLSYNLRSSTDLSTDPVTWEIVEGQAGLDSTASPIVIPRPADPKTFFVIESFED
ncbi:hypothetical protein N9105_05760 [Akkermansiaceae bacterium]|nr:hypothetical protein [Akkermansiaceae bacterium]